MPRPDSLILEAGPTLVAAPRPVGPQEVLAQLFRITLAAIGVVGSVTLCLATAFLGLDLTSLDGLEMLSLAAVPFLALAGAAGLSRRRPVMLGLVLTSTALVGFLLIGSTTVRGREAGQGMLMLWGLAFMLAACICLACVAVWLVVWVANLVRRSGTRSR